MELISTINFLGNWKRTAGRCGWTPTGRDPNDRVLRPESQCPTRWRPDWTRWPGRSWAADPAAGIRSWAFRPTWGAPWGWAWSDPAAAYVPDQVPWSWTGSERTRNKRWRIPVQSWSPGNDPVSLLDVSPNTGPVPCSDPASGRNLPSPFMQPIKRETLTSATHSLSQKRTNGFHSN